MIFLQTFSAAAMFLLLDQLSIGEHNRFWGSLPDHAIFSCQSYYFFDSELHLTVNFIEKVGCFGNFKSSIFKYRGNKCQARF